MAICKKEFANRMAENGGITKKSAFNAVGLFIETLKDYLSEDERVMFTGFGRFEIRTVKEKKGRNLHTGETCIIPEHEYVAFRASDLLFDSIRERGEDDTYGNEE
jgi:nucleoid DNA-binding protein